MTRTGQCWMVAFGLTLMTAACGSSATSDSGEQVTPIKRAEIPQNEFTPLELEATVDALVAAINESPLDEAQMVVLLKNLDDFFAPIATGANRAMGELGVIGNVIGPNVTTVDGPSSQELQNQQIAQAVADGAHGIGVSPFDTTNAAAVDDAAANGVPVVTLDSDLPDSKRSLYVGTLNVPAGATAAKTLLAMLPPPPGTVVIHGILGATWPDGYDRTQGALAAIEEAGYKPVVSEAIFGDENEASDIERMRGNLVAASPPAVGILGLFNISYRCVPAADGAAMPGLPIVTFDFDPRTVDLMRQNRIKATHTQRQYYEGYLVPYILYGMKSIGLEATRAILAPLIEEDESKINIGIDVVPAEKIDAYNDFLVSIGSIQ
ncbi:substrate-binding domain-containing protein [Sorangium cellulosum]|uniref:Sugar ABC transporter n=1 Tax=Sorangium cellulosum TaxID=56 RepID=A0A150QRL3_SORCE|nr:substrate-binding domain-containing protein [Sorangium cellulosum]KYF70482.1 sugar ABC transporter [Sorangium cellulosum]